MNQISLPSGKLTDMDIRKGFVEISRLLNSLGTSPSLPTGTVQAYVGKTAPAGWLLCNGSTASRKTYANLFTLIGITYGAGDGQTTFTLPDFRGMFLRGTGTHGTLKMANGTAFSGPSLGTSQNDQMAGHIHQQYPQAGEASGSGAVATGFGGTLVNGAAGPPHNDGTNGTPRSGPETRPASFGVNWIIKT